MYRYKHNRIIHIQRQSQFIYNFFLNLTFTPHTKLYVVFSYTHNIFSFCPKRNQQKKRCHGNGFCAFQFQRKITESYCIEIQICGHVYITICKRLTFQFNIRKLMIEIIYFNNRYLYLLIYNFIFKKIDIQLNYSKFLKKKWKLSTNHMI